MKRFSLLFITLLVLASSIVFCACGDKYKNLKIECNVEEINLVLDDDELSLGQVEFKLDGAKSWGEVSVVSNPSGLVQTAYEIDGSKCIVYVKALQPAGDGSELVITHLGSGKTCSVALNIGQKLKTLQSAGKDFIIQTPDFSGESEPGFLQYKEIDILTKQLVKGFPENFTDTIVWQLSNDSDIVEGVSLVSYNQNGDVVDTAFIQDMPQDPNNIKMTGTSQASRTILVIDERCESNSTITIQPISVLDDKAILHRDIKIDVCIMDLLYSSDIKFASQTHGDEEGVLKDLVLINNPDSNRPREIMGMEGYDFYSTAIVDLMLVESDTIIDGVHTIVLRNMLGINPKFEDLYTIELSTDIDMLRLEYIDFDTIRAIATSTCIGKGNITISFTPNNCVGDIRAFSVNIPCTIGERATSVRTTNNGLNVKVQEINDYNFASTTELNDSNSIGQEFKFEILGTNTLDALSSYKISINKDLLYVQPLDKKPYDWETNWDNYFYYDNVAHQYLRIERAPGDECPDFEQNKYYNNSNLLIKTGDNDEMYIDLSQELDVGGSVGRLAQYAYQISILKDGRDIKFYYDSTTGNFVTEPIPNKSSIYIKWVKTAGKDLDVDFAIDISNIYDERYDIANNEFEQTLINYKLTFDRQRTIESITYRPVKIVGASTINEALDAGNDWQFYFEPSMIDYPNEDNEFYGIKIVSMLGINGTLLTDAELGNIDLSLIINYDNGDNAIGFDKFVSGKNNYTFVDDNVDGADRRYTFNYDISNPDFSNIILLGKMYGEFIGYGDYEIAITQNNRELSTTNLRVYEQLTADNVNVSIPTADFKGDLLQYEYVLTTSKPVNWDVEYVNYYEYSGGRYINANATWDANKSYYQKVAIAVDIDNTYVLSTSSKYQANIYIDNEDFVNISGQEIECEIVGEGDLITINYLGALTSKDADGNNIITIGNYGTYNAGTGKKNYIAVTYTIKSNTYDYYKLNTSGENEISKTIYLYIYEPVNVATFDSTMLYKYDYNNIANSQLKQQYGEHTLNINLNDYSQTIFNYVDIKWTYSDEYISNFDLQSQGQASFRFDRSDSIDENEVVADKIIATLTQFGVQYPIYCNYEIRKPILSDSVELNTTINTFNSGEGYINLKKGESITIDAVAKSKTGKQVSFEGFEYIVCSTTGYALNGVASVDNAGLLTAVGAGKAKLIIIAKDRIHNSLSSVTNYFNTKAYVQNNASYIIVDIIVSDGSEQYPYLIATGDDFRKIAQDFDADKINNYHYALVNNINLGGQAIKFDGQFNGSIKSYDGNRYTIYGIMLNEQNPTLFKVLGDPSSIDVDSAKIKDIELYIDIDYTSTSKLSSLINPILIGLVGENYALIENVSVVISGKINANNLENVYTIGVLVAKNYGKIQIDDSKIIGVQGDILVEQSGLSGVVLGGVIGENQGVLIGANTEEQINIAQNNVEYEVYYDNQGATADVKLQVYKVSNTYLSDSAIGGVIGYNFNGQMSNVYSTGQIKGIDSANKLSVNNVGGLIGKNTSTSIIDFDITATQISGNSSISITYDADSVFQINNSYSSAKVMGNQNVGGAVGYDNRGSYNKVYYEIYDIGNAVMGSQNVGGLIGCANDSNLYYCYTTNFAWNYSGSVQAYDIIGETNVGGLIGLAQSSRDNNFVTKRYNYSAMNVVSSLASASLSGTYNVSGLIGRLNNYGAIYKGYYYGVIDQEVLASNTHPITKMYKDNISQNIVSYNNVYWIVTNRDIEMYYFNGESDIKPNTMAGFGENAEYNNAKPYLEYTYTPEGQGTSVTTNLVSPVPTRIQIDTAFTTCYNPNNNEMYKPNRFGDYVWDVDQAKYVDYNPTIHTDASITRYSLMANVISTGDSSVSLSDYRQKALVLYYYPLSDMSGENALDDYYYLNIVDMHDIVSDDGIIILPNTLKRFTLRTSDSSIVSILSGGRLLLLGEGQATITLVSILNPSVTASFVVIVQSKILDFNVYSSANLRDEYNINNQTINIVKNSSKILYADYSSQIMVSNRKYDYKQNTSTQIRFDIKYVGTDANITSENIYDYISLNNNYVDTYASVTAVGTRVVNGVTNRVVYGKHYYIIPYGTPITITVDEYTDGKFEITATPYVVAKYKNEAYTSSAGIELSSYLARTFNVVTKKGASAINTNKTQLNMMPASDASNLDIKITTDVFVPQIYFEIEAIGDKWEVENYLHQVINYAETLNISGVTLQNVVGADGKVIKVQGTLSLSNQDFDEETKLQELSLSLKLNNLSHYIDEAFRLQLKAYVTNNNNKISTNVYIDVKPQTISSVIAQNYRVKEGETNLDLSTIKASPVIRPGETNIIAIDVAPSIAIYDHVEIIDITQSDKILFQQAYVNTSGEFNLLENMDIWVDNGIELVKVNQNGVLDVTASKLYVMAKLPLKATANITHTIQINTYDKSNNLLDTTYLNLEAVMYPVIDITYTYPNGQSVNVHTISDGNSQHVASKTADLAVGVEAGLEIISHSIDEGTLKGSISITETLTANANNLYESYQDVVSLEYMFGKCYLRFNNNKQSSWNELIGKYINVTFTASKSLNGITETCSATINFKIHHIVIHGISMTHSTSNNKLYGVWDEEFETEFYFDKTDISFYNKGYWNVQYTIDNTDTTNVVDSNLAANLGTINTILRNINTITTSSEYTPIQIINTLNSVGANGYSETLSNIYSKNGISIINKDNKFKITATQGSNINNMKLLIKYSFTYINGYPTLIDITITGAMVMSSEFGFDITKQTTPFEEYIEIGTQQEFEDMIEGKFYKLTNNITFTDYTPINTAIGGLNGDGYTITIQKKVLTDGFNVAQLEQDYLGGAMHIGLFGTLQENSIIQNLQVNYDNIVLDLNELPTFEDLHTNDIYFGGVAGINLGVITNVNVLGSFILRSSMIGANYIKLGGIAGVNGSSSMTKVATITGSSIKLQMSAMASIGGASAINYGKITNTNFAGKISTNSENNQYVAEVTTAGFVVDNLSGAYISLSYVQCGLTNDSNIHSVGKTSGFVLNNAGSVNNCYINQTKITSQGNIGGFVYQNTGSISNCYANPSLGSSLFYNEFIYSAGDNGTLTNCYVITSNTMNINVSGLKKVELYNIDNKEQYTGLMFTNRQDGIWAISAQGPILPHSGFNSNRSQYNSIYNIYDVETFEGYFNMFGETIENKIFRLVRDIDFEQEGLETNPVTHSKTLKASFEGNDMTLSNYNIYKNSELDSIGLFAKIEAVDSGIYIRNLILKPTSIKATSGTAVGALAGIIDGANVYNITIDNPGLLILGKNAVGGLAGIIKGSFEVMGISTNVSAFATYTYNIGEQYSLYTGKNVTGTTLVDNLDEVSYVGSIAGIVDGYGYNTLSASDRSINYYYIVSDLLINDSIVLIGETVGGAIGLLGEQTLVKNVNYNLSADTLYKGVYVSGGLVGENRGIIQSSNIYAYQQIGGNKERVKTTGCFDGYASVNGAIVGLNIGGLVDSCTSDIDVYTTKSMSTSGGIVGRNIEGSVYNCIVYGSVEALFAGGIAGTDYSYSTIIKQQTGHGTATAQSAIVYRNVQNGVKYSNDSTLSVGYVANKYYSHNVISDKFLTTYISAKDKHYMFNPTHIDNNLNSLVNTSSVYGLVIGLTDASYGIVVTTDGVVNPNKQYAYSNQLIVDLTKGGNTDYINLDIDYNNRNVSINPIAQITSNKFSYSLLKAHLLYIVAYQNEASYEFWTSSLGYSQQYIAITDN